MKRRGTRKKPTMKARTIAPGESKVDTLGLAVEKGVVILEGIKKAPKRELKSGVIIEKENNLIALLDAGNVEEFRRQLDESRRQQRKQMFARVLAGL